MKKTTVLLVICVCCSLALGASGSIEPRGAWLQDGVKWVSAPQDISPHVQSAQVAILYFEKDHKFALIYCTVYRVPKQYMAISNGDPRGVYQGEWEAGQGGISVTYRLVEATILRKGQKLPGPMQHATIQISQGAVLTFEGKIFRRTAALDKSASEAVYGVGQSRNIPEHKGDALPQSHAALRTTRPDTVTTR